MAASTPVDSVLHDVDLLLDSFEKHKEFDLGVFGLGKYFDDLKLNLQFLKTFLLCARKWSTNYHVFLESSNDSMKVDQVDHLPSLLSSIEETVNKIGSDIQSLCGRLESSLIDVNFVFSCLLPVVNPFKDNLMSFRQESIEVYTTLSNFNISLQSSCCMTDDELVDFLDSLLKNLVHLLRRLLYHDYHFKEDYIDVLPAQIEALEDKLAFSKTFIVFAKLFYIEHSLLEDLLTHIQFVALNAARASYMCYMCLSRIFLSYTYLLCDRGEELAKMHSMMSDLVQKIKAVDLLVYENYIKVLRASKSSASLQTMKMDKLIVRDFTDSLITSLWEILLCNTSFMVPVKGQLQILYEGLRFFRSILRKPQKQMDELDGKIVTILGDTATLICSVYLNNQVNEVDVDSSVIVVSPDCCAMLDNINGDIKLIKTQIIGSSITESLPSYQMFKGQEVHKISSLMPSKGTIPITHELGVELEDEADKVIDRLVIGSKNLEIIPIVGMPGLGKTTLAKSVYNHPSILHHFHIHLWCSVSQVYNTKKLLLQILLLPHSSLDEGDLFHELYKRLKGNKYLIVFDDVWNIGVWNDFGCSFPDDKNGSRILFTSRFSNVASEVKIGREPHNLRSLTDEESWELLQKKVFGNEGCPQALHGLGMEIAKSCKGLPLTIVVMAGILATVEHDSWDTVAAGLISTTVYDQCKNTLELSYEYLPHYLKTCLLYFGAFPEDQEIHTKKLMWLWIAEGFVQNTKSKRLEDLAEEYLMDLIGRNLVMVAKQRSIGGVRSCRIHDLLHEFCKAKAKEENFLLVLQESEDLSTFNEPSNLERLSIWSRVEHFKKSKLFCPRICSLLLFNQIENSDALMSHMSFVFCIYKHLRVLNLEQIILQHKDFPREVESLVELRYLGVQGLMKIIPPSIANLQNLETFLVITKSGPVTVPDTIWKMTELRHLHAVGRHIYCSLSNENLENTSDLHKLETLSTLIVCLGEVENIVSKIPNIRKLKILLLIAKESTGFCNMNPLASLESLKVSANKWPQIHVEFSFPMTLKKLVLEGLRMPWSKIQLIGELSNLEVLKLLQDSFEGKRWDLTDGGFVKLRFLSLKYLDVVEWTDTGCDDPFPSLQKLLLTGLSGLEEVPSSLESIPNLEVIMVQQCNDSVKSLVQKIEEEQKSFGNENLKTLIE
ncbi:hypothetical protein ACH5RR_028402 [Cinchona calisaya]|uniref:Uncharacterized protein n=1 Tax=Cinchona calisaya TaxID=153742 RepID=A0ABD2YNP0_9GENT